MGAGCLNFTSNAVRLRFRCLLLAFLLLCVVVPIQFAMVRAEVFSDPTGDLFDNQGRQVTAEPYLDPVAVELAGAEGSYSALIRVNGALPSSLADPTLFLEWDLMVDVDQNPGTHPWGPWSLLDNGIGVDLLVRLMLGPSGQGYRAEVFNMTTLSGKSIDFKVDGATVQLNFNDKSLGIVPPEAFDFVFTARKYGNYGRSGSELALDKAPNEGHFTFSNGIVSVTTATSRIGPEQVLNHTISEDLTGSPDYAPVNITHIFSVEDPQVVCQYRIRDVPAGESFGFRWYSPDGKLYEEYFYPPTSSFSQVTTVDRLVEIRGSSAAKMPGKWRVEGYAGNQLLFADTFTIQSASQTTTASETSPTATVTVTITSVSSESTPLLLPIAIVAVVAISLSYVWSRKRSRSRRTAKQGPDTKN
jgi:hypothetical protein